MEKLLCSYSMLQSVRHKVMYGGTLFGAGAQKETIVRMTSILSKRLCGSPHMIDRHCCTISFVLMHKEDRFVCESSDMPKKH